MYRKFLAIIMAVGLVASLASCSTGSETTIDPASLRGGETRETLPPMYFTGAAAEAYRVAKEIPEVLDSLYCYCDCEKHSGHKSLLACYVDEHAQYCDICINEALLAYDLHKKGYDVVSIRKTVDETFSGINR